MSFPHAMMIPTVKRPSSWELEQDASPKSKIVTSLVTNNNETNVQKESPAETPSNKVSDDNTPHVSANQLSDNIKTFSFYLPNGSPFRHDYLRVEMHKARSNNDAFPPCSVPLATARMIFDSPHLQIRDMYHVKELIKFLERRIINEYSAL